MVLQVQASDPKLIYPDSDGQPMADNTKQFRWIVLIQQNLETWFANDPNVFVAGDLLWYPVEGEPKIRQAPDAMVVLGRPKGDRGSYQQWKEDNIAPQVVFEVRSPGNSQTELDKKLLFYERYGVEEYYLYDPDRNDLSGWIRLNNRLAPIDAIDNWVSPRLAIRFEWSTAGLQLYLDNGMSFTTLEQERRRAEQEKQRAEQEKQRAELAEKRAAQLADKLRAMGIDPDAI
ncbi:MAG: Uma2 family endonuclease [Thermosynechococcaceae cyanobacterium]